MAKKLSDKVIYVSRQWSRSELVQQLRTEITGYLGAASDFDERLAKKMKLSRTDMRCLDLIARHGPLTAGRLAEESGLTTGAVTFILDRLEEAGMVTRRRDTEDRRRVWVEIVPEAQERLAGPAAAGRRGDAPGGPALQGRRAAPSCATSCARPRRSSSARSRRPLGRVGVLRRGSRGDARALIRSEPGAGGKVG